MIALFTNRLESDKIPMYEDSGDQCRQRSSVC